MARGDGFLQCRIMLQLAVLYCFTDSGVVLVDDTAGTNVHMPDLGIPHLAGRQAYGFTGGFDSGMAAHAVYLIPAGCAGLADGVIGGILPAAPAIQNHQNQRAAH